MVLKKWLLKSKPVLCIFCFCFCLTTYASDKLPYVDDYWTLSVQEIDQRAQAGDPFAMSVLSTLYLYGAEGYPLDETQAQYFREKAQAAYVELAQEGNIPALFRAGEGYLQVEVSDADRIKALTMLQAAADKGYLKAKVKLADLYRSNRYEIPTDSELSDKLYQEVLPIIEQQAPIDLFAKDTLFRMYKDELGGLVRDDKKIATLNQEIIQEYRKKVQTSDQHALSPISLLILFGNYQELFKAQNTRFWAISFIQLVPC